MLLCYVVDELLDKDGLADSGSSEEADLTTLKVRLKQVNDLDSGKEDFLRRRQILKLRRFSVYREGSLTVKCLHSVDGIAHHIHHAATDLSADRHGDRRPCRLRLHSTLKSVSAVHCDSPYGIFTNMLLDFQYELSTIRTSDSQGLVDRR